MSALEIDRVSKRYGDLLAVNDLSFSVQPGEIFGFLGGNGAGKTTTLRMVLDIIRPSSGHISVLGQAPGPAQSAMIGFLPEERGLYGRMSAIETVTYFGRLKGLDEASARSRGFELLERFGLGARTKAQIRDLSKGMAQKVQLATALVNRPQLLILDEPFSGLDPLNQQLLEDEIVRASADGAAVIFSTHVMQHAERLCNRLLLLRKGEKRFEGDLAQARAVLPIRITATARDDIAALRGLAQSREIAVLDDGWRRWELQLEPGIEAARVLEYCTSHQIALREFSLHHPSLHEVFVHLVGDELQGTGA